MKENIKSEIHFPLGNGKWAITNLHNADKVFGFAWSAKKSHRTFYAVASGAAVNRKQPFLQMHRVIAGAKGLEQVDHIDGNGLNNRDDNLRIATNQQNQQNRKKATGRVCSSQFKGVCFEKSSGKWMAQIGTGGKHKKLGRFINEIDAARAYDSAAKEYFGEFASYNLSQKESA